MTIEPQSGYRRVHIGYIHLEPRIEEVLQQIAIERPGTSQRDALLILIGLGATAYRDFASQEAASAANLIASSNSDSSVR